MFKKHTVIALIAAICFFISGCDENKDKVIKTAEDQIKVFLDDPNAATFSDIKVVKEDGDYNNYMVCGAVNSKDKKGNDYRNEFATYVYEKGSEEDGKFKTDGEFDGIPEPRYDFVTGSLNDTFYINQTACTDGFEAYHKKLGK